MNKKIVVQKQKDTPEKSACSGRFRIKSYDKETGQLKRVSPWMKNMIVSSSGHGLNLIPRLMTGDETYPLEITQAKIGTGTTPPTLSDTDLETPELAGILVANNSVSNNVVTFEFFISDGELPDDTYNEWGIFAGNQLFSRVIISPAYTKASNEDTSVEHELTFTSV